MYIQPVVIAKYIIQNVQKYKKYYTALLLIVAIIIEE